MASLLDWLGGQVEGTFAQANPFDNGATYASVQKRRRDEQQRQLAVPQPSPRPSAPQPPFRSAVPSINTAALSQNAVANRPLTAPINPLKAVGDFGNGVVGFGRDLALGTASTGQKVFNTGVAAATGVIGGLSTDPRIKQAAIDQRKAIFNTQKTITGDKATFFDNYDQAMNTNGDLIGNITRPALRTVAEVAPYVVPFGKFTGSVPAQIAKASATNAAVAGGTNAALQAANTGDVNLGQVGQSALVGGVIGGAIPAAGAGVRKLRQRIPSNLKQNVAVRDPNAPIVVETKGQAVAPAAAIKTPKQSSQTVVNNRPVLKTNPSAKLSNVERNSQIPVVGQTSDQLLPQTPPTVRSQINQALNSSPKVQSATTQAAQTGGSPVLPSTQGKGPLKAATQSRQNQLNLTLGGRRGVSAMPETAVPTQRQPKISAPADQGSLELPKANPSTTKIQQKAPLVDEGRRAINSKATSGVSSQSVVSGNRAPAKNPEGYYSPTASPSVRPRRAAQPVESSSLVKAAISSNRTAGQLDKIAPTAPKTDTKTLTTVNRSYIDNTTTEVKKRGFTQSVKTSTEVSPTVRKQVAGEYNVRSTDKMALQAHKFAQGNLKKVTTDVNERLAKKLGTVTDQDIADSIAVAKRLDSKGSFDASQQIYDRLAEHGTKGGQTIQAFSLLQNRTPEGIKFQMLRNLKQAGVTLTKDQQKEVSKLIDQVRSTKPKTEARNRALFDTLDYVSKKIPSNNGDKIINFWRAGLLTAPKTTGGNIVGNTSELVARELWANPVAVATDKFFSLFTGKRTKTLSGGQLKGMQEGVVKGIDFMKTGYDPRNVASKWDAPRRINYKNKAIDGYVNGVYRWMGSQDQPFYYGAKAAAAYDLAKADAMNLGFKGDKLAKYVEQAVNDSNWKPQTFKTAKAIEDYARYAVYQNDTLLGQMAQGVKKAADRKGLRWMTDFILPFTQVPSSIAMRVVDRTPIGTVRELIKQIRRGSFDQRAMAEAIGNGSFGIPVVAAGFALSKAGEITGDYPTDSREKKLWEEEGKQPYSVRIGDKWYSLNYLQPFGTILNIGKNLDDQKKAGKSDSEAWMTAVGSAGQSVTDQSFLKGLNGVLSALNDPERSLESFTKSTAGSTVPNFVRSFASATDDKQRDTKGVNLFDSSAKSIQSSVPGLRQGLPEKKGMFGNTLERRDGAISSYLNPLRPSTVKNQNDAVLKELRRLQDGGNGIVTTDFNKNAIKDVVLSDPQVRELNQQINSRVKPAWDKAMADTRYQALSDEEKNTVLKRIKDNIAKEVKGEFVQAYQLQTTGNYVASNSDPFGAKTTKQTKIKLAATRRRSGRQSSSGATAGKQLVSLTSSVNKIRVPRTTGSQGYRTSVRSPQLKKASLRRFTLAKATIKGSKKTIIKPSKA